MPKTRPKVVSAREKLKQLCRVIARGGVVCLTGAGISCASGIPVFRGKDGLWKRYDPAVYGTSAGLTRVLKAAPEEAVDFLTDFYGVLLDARPNPGHASLALLEKQALVDAVITQNIDNLHQQAGTRSIVELHGNAFRIRCDGCAHTLVLEKERVREMLVLLKKGRGSSQALLRVLGRYFPRCPDCRHRSRIDIVLFGEMLSEAALARSYRLLDACRTLLIVGSSLEVYPAAALPQYAKQQGKTLIEINTEPSALAAIADFKIMGDAAEVLPELVALLGKG